MMKKIYLFFLFLSLWGLSSAYAQSVTLIDENFTSGEVTFSVDVGAATPTWVLVEYTTAASHNPANMSRATFTNVLFDPQDAGTWIAGSTETAGDRGFRLIKNATITAKLKDVSGRFSWCAYVFDAPPNAKLAPDGSYSLHGTPPFIVNDAILDEGVTTFGPGTCIESITDFTYNPDGNPSLPAVTVSASETEVCAGTEVTFTATASGGTTTAMSYTWDVAGITPSITLNTYSQILATAGNATYTVRVTNVNGCTSTASGTVTVNPMPEILVDGMPGSACVDDDLNVQASGAFAGGSYCFSSYVDGIGNSDCEYRESNTYSVNVPATSTTTIRVLAMTAAGCVDSVLVHVPYDRGPDCINRAGTIATNPNPPLVKFILGYPPQKAENKPQSEVPASNLSATYEWRRTGTSSAILANSNMETYNIANDHDAIYTAGTYYYNRYIRDGTPENSVGLRADGTYTMIVVAPPLSPSGTLTWRKSSSQVIWSGNSRANSNGLSAKDQGTDHGLYYRLANNYSFPGACPDPWFVPSTSYYSTANIDILCSVIN
jgi:hypothetical protein